MKAIVQDEYGSPDVLQLQDIEKPVCGDDEVLVRVHSAGVDRGVWHLMAGQPYLVRIMGFGLRKPKNRVPGLDAAGTVEAVGKDVVQLKPGDKVFGECNGSFAEYACAPARKLAHKPANLSHEQAAVVSVSGRAALQAVRDEGKVQPGQGVLILGAAGGVGTYAVQIAKAFGAEVTGVCSTSKTELVLSIGADHVIDYTQEDFADGQRQYDVILDIAGNRTLPHLRRALSPIGALVIVGGEEGGRWFGGMDRQIRALLISRFSGQQLRAQFPKEDFTDLAVLKELIEAGKVTPVIDRMYPLSEVPDAIRYLQEGRAQGKVVITI